MTWRTDKPRARRSTEVELARSLATLRARHGDDVAQCAIAALVECLAFIEASGHGNITLAVKDHRVGGKVRFEYYRDLGLNGDSKSSW